MNENFQNENQPPIPPQQERQPSVIQSEDKPYLNSNGGASGLFKTAFVIAMVLTCLLLGPSVLSLPTADGWGGIATALGFLLIWGFSIAALLFTAFLKDKFSGKVVSFIYGSAVGAQAALLLLLIVISIIRREPTTIGARLLPIAIYILATAPILLFVRYMGRKVAHSTDGGATKTGNFGVISLVLGLVLSLGASWVAYPDFHIDRLGPKSPELVEYEKCLARSTPGEFNSEHCLTPNDPHIIGFPPQTFGFPIHSSNLRGDLTNFSLYFFVVVPNWLLWSIAVYILLSVGNWIKLRMSNHV